jgi:hypothetical protein
MSNTSLWKMLRETLLELVHIMSCIEMFSIPFRSYVNSLCKEIGLENEKKDGCKYQQFLIDQVYFLP